MGSVVRGEMLMFLFIIPTDRMVKRSIEKRHLLRNKEIITASVKD